MRKKFVPSFQALEARLPLDGDIDPYACPDTADVECGDPPATTMDTQPDTADPAPAPSFEELEADFFDAVDDAYWAELADEGTMPNGEEAFVPDDTASPTPVSPAPAIL